MFTKQLDYNSNTDVNIRVFHGNVTDQPTRCSRQNTPPANLKLAWSYDPTNFKLAWSYDPTKHNPWQSQKLSQTKIPIIICPFFYLSKPKQINKVAVLKIKYAFNLSYNSRKLQTKHKC